MNAIARPFDTSKYARVVEASKRVRWDIDRDVIRGRRFELRASSCPTGCRSSTRCRCPDAREALR